MPPYLVQVAYTAEAWAAQLKHPRDRQAIVRPLFDQLGGHIATAYYAFGPFDVVLIADLPDNRSAAALSLALTAGGAVKTIQTTPLLPLEDGLDAMRQAAAAGAVYQSPVAGLQALAAELEAFEEGP